MEKRVLNGLFMTTREKAHAHIRARLALPDYYGENLDALHDCLTDLHTPTQITLRFAGFMQKKLGAYGVKLLSLLIACTGENPKLSVRVRNGL